MENEDGQREKLKIFFYFCLIENTGLNKGEKITHSFSYRNIVLEDFSPKIRGISIKNGNSNKRAKARRVKIAGGERQKT